MKGKLKMIRNIVCFGALYYIMQWLTSLGYGIFYSVTHPEVFRNLSQVEATQKMQSLITENVATIIFIAAVVTVIIYYLILRKKEKTLLSRCNFKKISINNILYIIIASIGISCFSILLMAVLYERFPSYQSVQAQLASASNSLFGIAVLVVFVPIFEEILFRGLVFHELKNNLNIILTIFLQAVLFGVYHANMLQAIYVFFFAIVLGLVYYWTGSIWSSILCHCIYNYLGTSGVFNKLLQHINIYVLGIGGLILTIITMILMYKSYSENQGVKVNV